MRCTTLVALLMGVVLYLVMGALVFGTLEFPEESLAYNDLLATKNSFLDNNSCVTEQDFYKLVKGVVSAVEAGLDFFGENLAYIDESSDTLSDRAQPGASEEKRRRPRKPKRRSMRRQLSHRWSPMQVRRPSRDMLPPSNPPTPPPESSLSDSHRSENQTGSAPTL